MKNTATCTEEGTRTLVCEKCKDIKTEEVPAKGHTVDLESATIITEKTCTTDGEARGTCTECHKDNIKAVIPASHEYYNTDKSKDATCTDDGLDSRICKICGDTIYKVIPAKGHTIPETVKYYKVGPKTNTDENGIVTYVKDEDGKIQYKTVKKGTDISDTFASMTKKEINKILCTDGIVRKYKCSDCNEDVKETVYDIKGHNFVTEKDATCTEEGNEICSVCGEKQTIDSLGHDFTGSEVVEMQDGKYSYCNRCKKLIKVETYQLDEEIPDLDKNAETKDKTEQEVNERMGKVSISSENNVITITQNAVFANEDNGHQNCIGIIIDLGIEASNVEVISKNYIINPEDRTGASKWANDTNENSLLIWLSPSDFNKGDIVITFRDKTKPESYPISVTFKYVKSIA